MNLQFKSVKNNFACSLFRGFNEVLNGLADDGWSVIESDGIDDVCISVNSSKVTGCNATFSSGLTIVSTGVLCAKASMLLQVSFTMKLELIFFLFGWSCPVFFIQYFCCLLGCLSSITTAIFARTPVTVGRQQFRRILRLHDETKLLQFTHVSSWRIQWSGHTSFSTHFWTCRGKSIFYCLSVTKKVLSNSVFLLDVLVQPSTVSVPGSYQARKRQQLPRYTGAPWSVPLAGDFLIHETYHQLKNHFLFSSVKLVFLAWLQWQMYNGVEESSAGTCSELIFAPIDASFSDDSPLLPSGFYIIPIDSPL